MSKKKTEFDEQTVETAESVVDAEFVAVVEQIDPIETFIRNKLIALNKLDNPAKAERLAKRILNNRKEK